MAVETTDTSASFTGTGASASYAPGFYVNSSAQAHVYVDGVLKTLGVDYVVNDVGVAAGCTIVGTFALGADVYIERATPVTQLVDTQNNETILEDVLDAAFDKLTMIAQETLGKAVLAPTGESGYVLPPRAAGEGKALVLAGGAFAWAAVDGTDSALVINAPLLPGSYLYATANQAILDGVAAAVTAAGGGVVQLPAGDLYINDFARFHTGKLTIRGLGKQTTTLIPLSATGGALWVGPASDPGDAPTEMLTGVSVKDFTIYGGNGDPSSSIMLVLDRCQDIDVDVGLGGGWGGVDLVSCRGGSINTLARGNANFSSAKAGSFLRRWRQWPGGYLPAEIHARGNEVRGNNLNAYLEFCDLVQASDGLFLEPYHGGFAKHTLALIPETATTQLTGIKAELWSDSSTVSGVVCRYDGAGTYSGQFGLHRIVVSNGYDTPKAIHVNLKSSTAANNLPSQIVPGQLHHITDKAIHFEVARNWVLAGGADIEDTVIGIELGADAQDIVLHPGRIRRGQGGADISQGVNILNGATDFRILPGWEFEGCSFDIADNATTTDKTIGTITTDKGLQTVNASGAGALYIPAGVGAVTVGTAYNVGQITSSGGDGDILMLTFAGSVNVFDTNNLKIAGTFAATADDWLVLRQQGGNWYELSRSAN